LANMGVTMAERQEVLELAAQIVSAHISNNAVASDQLPALIRQIANTLATVEQTTSVPPKAEPAVPVGKSILAGHLVCLDCGKHFSMLKRHLMTDKPTDAGAVSTATPGFVPDRCTELCQTRSALAK
jgi:predicted transcriptional regulator